MLILKFNLKPISNIKVQTWHLLNFKDQIETKWKAKIISLIKINTYLVFNSAKRSFTEGKVVIICSFLSETGSEETDSTFSPDSKGAERLHSATESVRKILIYTAATAAVRAATY